MYVNKLIAYIVQIFYLNILVEQVKIICCN